MAFCCREVDKISPTFEEKPLITKNELCKFTFDYIIIANKGSFYSIQKEAYEFIKKENRNVFIISAQIFKIPRFDFVKDIENNDSLLSLISDRERIQGYEVFNWDNCNTTEYSIRDEGFISSYQKCKNFKEKYSQLIKGFSDSEVKKRINAK